MWPARASCYSCLKLLFNWCRRLARKDGPRRVIQDKKEALRKKAASWRGLQDEEEQNQDREDWSAQGEAVAGNTSPNHQRLGEVLTAENAEGGRGRGVAQNTASPIVFSSRESRAGTTQRETGIGVDEGIWELQAKAAEAKKKLEEAKAKAQHADVAQEGLARGGRASVAIDHVAYQNNSTPSMVFSSRRFDASQVGQWV
jgi:hypothetical protein